MRNLLRSSMLLGTLCTLFNIAIAQPISIKGKVTDGATKQGIPAVSVVIKGTNSGTYTNENGEFTLTTSAKLPITLEVSAIGFESSSVTVSKADGSVDVAMKASSSLGQEVVVSATRTPSRIMESPVTIERISANAIQRTPAANYYDIIRNVKGVDFVTSSLTFSTPTTRGFSGSGNTRFNQLVDGMDNQAPGLNFSVGSIVGLNELDVDNMELLPGASSALYGPGGMNGTLLINSKNPFKYTGLSFNVKTGIMHTDEKQRPPSPYYNWSVRWANKVGNRFAYKFGAELIQAKDWLAMDYRNFGRVGTAGSVKPGDRATDPNYDGINVYGDETTADIRANVLNAVAAQIPFLKPYIDTLNGGAPINVSRTGYTEKEVVDPNTINFKLSGAMHYKITDNLEAVVAGFFGTGNTVYTGSDRYSLRELKMSQYKVELNSKNWFIRGWTTQENAGESYNATVTTRLFNEAWKPSGGSTGWYAQYGQSYLANRMAGMSDQAAHTASRALADVGRPASGSQQFREIFDRIRKVPISDGGGLFVDKTDLYALEGQYNLSDLFNNKLDVLIGGNFRQFILNSEGTLFADTAGTIKIKEGGAYLQLGKSIFNDNLRLLASVRFDKNENFDGRFTPRVTALWKVAQDHNIRFSYQTAYRFPSTQQQYIDLVVGQGVRLIGGTDFMLNKYGINETPSYTINSFQSYAASVQRGQPNPSLLKTVSFPKFNAEYVNSFEVGYKGLMANKKLLVDLYAYYGMYNNFVVRTVVAKTYSNLAPGVPDPRNNYIFSVPTNLDGNVSTYGAGLSLDYSLSRGYYINANLTTDYLQEVPEGYVAFFNAPKYRAVLGVGNVGFGPKKRLGFNVSMRWQDGFLYESDFATGQIPSATVFDGQVSYRVPEKKLLFRLGGTNIANSYYRNSFGNPEIGGMYYFSIGYNL